MFQATFRAFALLCAVIVLPIAQAQPYPHPETVYVPLGKVPAARVTSVSSILQHYTAADLEMKTGDLIFAIDGQPIDSAEKFTQAFAQKTGDVDVRIDFVRDGVVHQSVGPTFRFTRGIFKSDKPKWGAGLETTTVDFAPSLLQKPVVRHITVLHLRSVKTNTAAGNAGLQKGDLLLRINGRTMGRVDAGDIILPLFPEGTPLTFVYLRDGKMNTGKAPLTLVKTGFTKSLLFGFYGESHMSQLQTTDVPEEAPRNVQVEKPASHAADDSGDA